MTAYPSKPAAVATVEQELTRLLMFYRDVNPKKYLLEETNFSMPVATWDWKPAPDGQLLFVARATILIDSAIVVSGSKPWMAAQEMPGAATLTGNSYTT